MPQIVFDEIINSKNIKQNYNYNCNALINVFFIIKSYKNELVNKAYFMKYSRM